MTIKKPTILFLLKLFIVSVLSVQEGRQVEGKFPVNDQFEQKKLQNQN